MPRPLWAILLVVFAVYAPSLGNGYAIDSRLLAKPTLSDGGLQPVVGTLHGPEFYFERHYWAGTSSFDGLYRPVTIYSFAVTNHWFGGGGFAHHAIDLALHLLAVFLVWRMLAELRVPRTAALATTLLFGVHAIHHEVVVSIVGRGDLLAFVSGLGALLLFRQGSISARIASSALLWVALCSKESALAWVAFAPCFQWAAGWRSGTPERPWPWIRDGLWVILPPIVLWLILRHHALADLSFVPREIDNLKNPLAHVDTTARILTAVKIWGYGLAKCLVPYPLSILYGMGTFTLVTSPADPGFLTAAVVLLGLLALGILFARRVPLVFLAAILVLGFGLTTSNLLFPVGTNFAERFFYTPSLGLCLLFTLGWIRFAKYRTTLILILGSYALGNAAVILHRNTQWQSEEALVRHDAGSQPNSANLLNDLSAYLWHADPPEREQAIACVDRALELYPEFPQALYKRAANALAAGDRSAALRWFAATSHSPYIQITLRLAIQEQLEQLLFPTGLRSLDAAGITATLRARGEFAATWVACIDRGLDDPDFPRQVLRSMVETGRTRFGQDELLAIQQGLFLATDQPIDASLAARILDAFTPGLWRIQPGDVLTTHFVRAHLIAATCFDRLARPRTGAAVLQRLLDNPGLPPSVRRRVASALRELVAEAP